jgi:hypothetical protein
MGCCEFRDNSKINKKTLDELPKLIPKVQITKKKLFLDHGALIKDLKIEDSESIPDDIGSIKNISSYAIYEYSPSIKIQFDMQDSIHLNIVILLNQPISYKIILNLINSPKFRLQWDIDLDKMVVSNKECFLSGKAELFYKGSGRHVFEITVKKFENEYFLMHKLDSKASECVLYTFLELGKFVNVYFKQDKPCEDIESYLTAKSEWAENLLNEIYTQNSYISNNNV